MTSITRTVFELNLESFIGYLKFKGIKNFEDMSENDSNELILTFLQTPNGQKYFDGLRDRTYEELDELFTTSTLNKTLDLSHDTN